MNRAACFAQHADIFARHAALVANGMTAREASAAMLVTELQESARASGLPMTHANAERQTRDMLARFPLPMGTP